MGAGLLRVVIALLPLASSPLLAYLIAAGRLDLGGGEKDLVWVLPWLLSSLLFAISSFVLWYRGASIARATAVSALVAFAGVLAAAVVLAGVGQLGVGGRF